MTRSHTEFSDDHTPLAFHITFRGYGTWLHGDSRGSVDRFHRAYGTPTLPPNSKRKQYEKRLLKQPPVKLSARQGPQSRAEFEKPVNTAGGRSGPSTFAQIMFIQ